jgi:hypothetical protein
MHKHASTYKKAKTDKKRGSIKRYKKTIRLNIAASSVPMFMEPSGRISLDRITEAFGVSRARLAETIGVAPETLQRPERARSPKTQTRLREMTEIIHRISGWAGGPLQAMAWYRAEPIPAFGGRTAESLVKDGKAAAVRDYLDSVALGGFA